MLFYPKPKGTNIFLFILSFFFSNILLATDLSDTPSYAVSLIPDSLLENANTVIRTRQQQYHVHNIGKANEKIRAAITIINSKSPYSDLRINYDQFTKIKKIKARIYNSAGVKVREISKSEIQDFATFDGFSIYNDNRFKYIDFTYGSYPYTIEYEYELEHKGLQSYAFWYPQHYKTSVEKSDFEVSLPSSMNFRYKAFNLRGKPSIRNHDNRKSHLWTLSNLVAISKEAYTPENHHTLPVLWTLPNDFEVDGHKGNMETWQAFGQFMYQLNHNRDQLSPEMTQKVRSLTANVKSDVEKIEILYDYLKENMRYVSVQLGIGGWQTYDANYVEKNKYGDCKALTNFMKGMLKTAGIKSYAALVTAGEQNIEFTEDFTIPYFNHVILNIPQEEEDIWLECTSNTSPVNYLGSHTENRPSLLITEKGGILTKTPRIRDNKQLGKTLITLAENGAATVESHTKYTGKLHEYIRQVYNNYGKEEQAKWFTKVQSFPAFEIEQLNIQAAPSKPEATCNFKIKVQRYASKAGKRQFVPINLINQLARSLPKNDKRKQPLEIKNAYEDIDEIIIKLPSSYKVESLPKNTEKIESPYGTYSIEIENKDDHIIYKRNLKLNAVSLPAEKYNELRDFYKKISKMDNAKLVLTRKSA